MECWSVSYENTHTDTHTFSERVLIFQKIIKTEFAKQGSAEREIWQQIIVQTR